MRNIFLLLMVVSFAFVGLASARAGNEGGNGGDELALGFQNAAMRAVSGIEAHGPAFAGIDVSALRSAIKNASLLVVDQALSVSRNGMAQESVAVNTPSTKTILLSRFRWENIANAHLQEAMALHEYLGLLGLEHTGDYKYSAEYLKIFFLAESELVPNFAANKSIVSCNDYQRGLFSASLINNSQIRVSLTPVQEKQKAKLTKFLAAVGYPSAEEAVSLSLEVRPDCNFFDPTDRSFISCAGNEKQQLNIRLRDGRLELFKVPFAQFYVAKGGNSPSGDLFPSAAVIEAGQSPDSKRLYLDFDSRSCR
jgi:hypothetical protein